jgi:uncharacterized protein
MLSNSIIRIVVCCAHFHRTVIAIAAIVAAAAAVCAIGHFKITTDTEQLLPRDVAWQQNQRAYAEIFPESQIVAVVEAPTPELAGIAATRLVDQLRKQTTLFNAVQQPLSGAFMARNGLLYRPLDQVVTTSHELRAARPVI